MRNLYTKKVAALLPDVQLQPHQQEVAEAAAQHPLRVLLYHSLGSGKSLSGIAAAEAREDPYVIVTPASIRQNYYKELDKFSDRTTPAAVVSYHQIAKKQLPFEPETLIFDEAHRLRNEDSRATQAAIELAKETPQVVLLSGTPVVNSIGDFAVPYQILTGEDVTTDDFEKRFTKQKKVYDSLFHRIIGKPREIRTVLHNENELKKKLKGKVHWFQPGSPPVEVDEERIYVEMSPEQANIYRRLFDKLPWWAQFKIRNSIELSDKEIASLKSFMTGPRRIGLSDYGFTKEKDPYKSFTRSKKLQTAFQRTKETIQNTPGNVMVYSNFIDAGLRPYAAALEKEKIPYAIFHGGLTDKDRKKIIDDYNSGRIRVILVGPSGSEGLNLKNTRLIQVLDPHWNENRTNQAIGRGIRFDSHIHLPEDQRNVKIERYFSRLPNTFFDNLLERIGFDRSHKREATDDYLQRTSDYKADVNRQFLNLLQEIGKEPLL